MLKKIENPNLSTIDNKKIAELFQNKSVQEMIQKSLSPYAHWEKIKHWQMPNGVNPIELWAVIKLVRSINKRVSVILDEKGKPFSWTSFLPGLSQFLHDVDMRLGGNLFLSGNQLDDEFQHRLLSRGVMEEAIASSQLEGAHTTRKVAKQILLEKRKPKNKDEQMIVNNYEAMRLIEDELKNKELSEDILLFLHRVLTKNVLNEPETGRYRNDKDDIIVGDGIGEISHIPPKAEFVKKEIKKFINYANNELKDFEFVHPVIKAIMLHFWIGYLHPFVDGNGRIARALFYWYLLREKYWAFGYIPLSKVIKNSPGQYGNAYVFSEQDDNDLTYFIAYNVDKIIQAIEEFDVYAERKWKENAYMAKLSRGKYKLNDRQIQLLRYYYKNKDATTSIKTHMKINETSRITAMKDLKKLEDMKFVNSKKVGKTIYYYGTEKISELFN